MNEWKECKLGDIIITNAQSITNDYPHKTIQYLDTGSITRGKIDSFQELSLRSAPSRAKRLVKEHDIVYSTVRPIQRHYGYIVNPPENLVVSTGFAVIETNKDLAEPLFIYNFLSSKDIVETLDTIAEGSTSAYPSLKPSDIENMDILLPPPPEQQAIATVLSSLDDKIDLLHRQNKTLEAMAETLFRQWFIEEADEGWKDVKIKDFDVIVTDFVANGSFASLKENVTLVNDKEDYALFIRNTDLKSDFSTKVYVTEHSYNFLKKTRLFGGEVIISSVGDVGSVFRCPKFNIPMTLGNNVIMLKSDFNLYFYLFFNSDYGQGLIYGITSGSVQEKFNKTVFRDLSISYPDIEYIRRFETQVKTLFEKIDINKAQIHTVEKLRDTLLPKLMSGEVRVVA